MRATTIKITILIATLGLLVISWALFRLANSDLYKAKEPTFLLDVGAYNELNEDNEIFKTDRIFLYKLSFSDKFEQKTLCLQPKVTGVGYDLIPAGEISSNVKYCIDYIRLSVFRNKGDTNLGETQTIIKYDFFDGERKVFLGEKTGVVEDSTKIFLHPPRSHFFFFNQFNPFPFVRFPIEESEYWEFEFRIPEHALEKVQRLRIPTLKIMYKLSSKEQIRSPWGLLDCYKFIATGLNDEIETRSIYLFNPKYGFLRMEFWTIEGVKIEMTLIDISMTIPD